MVMFSLSLLIEILRSRRCCLFVGLDHQAKVIGPELARRARRTDTPCHLWIRRRRSRGAPGRMNVCDTAQPRMTWPTRRRIGRSVARASSVESPHLDKAVDGRGCLFKSCPRYSKGLETGPLCFQAREHLRKPFARYLYRRYTGLKRELDRYLTDYNTDRVHHGRITNGRIPADIVHGARKVEAHEMSRTRRHI